MTTRRAKAAITTSIALLAACRSAPPIPPAPQAPSSILAPQAPVAPVASAEPVAQPAPPSDGKCGPSAPKIDPSFAPISLRFEQRPDGTTGVVPEVARRFPVISHDGRTMAILDERENVEEGASLHLAILDVRREKLSSFTLWARSKRPARRAEAQLLLDKARWQSMVPSEDETCRPRAASASKEPTVRFEGVEFELLGLNRQMDLLRRTSAGETKVEVVAHALPGKMGEAAVPTNDVGLSCGMWDHLAAGWVSQDGKVYLFKLGAHLGARCGPAPTPVDYSSWVSPDAGR